MQYCSDAYDYISRDNRVIERKKKNTKHYTLELHIQNCALYTPNKYPYIITNAIAPPKKKKKSIPVVTGIKNFGEKHKEAAEITTTTLRLPESLMCVFFGVLFKCFAPAPPSPATNSKHTSELISS